MTKMMYGWINKKWTPVGGSCPIACPYCLVNSYKKRFPQHRAKYTGEPRLVGPWPKFKAGDVVFVCHMTDLFAMPISIIKTVLNHCWNHPAATYVFQSKLPSVIQACADMIPQGSTVGTTIETDLMPEPILGDRIYSMRQLRDRFVTFITVEPIQKFSQFFASTIMVAKPSFINIGSDSKGSGLPEPTAAEVLKLIADLRGAGIEVRLKPNLKRILGKGML